jgi:hypothetical protein
MAGERRSVRAVRLPAAYGTSEAEPIILEGTAEYVTDPAHSLAAPSAAASKAKYPQYFSGTDTS